MENNQLHASIHVLIVMQAMTKCDEIVNLYTLNILNEWHDKFLANALFDVYDDTYDQHEVMAIQGCITTREHALR